MAIQDTARNLYSALGNGSGALGSLSQAAQQSVAKAQCGLDQAIRTFNALNPGSGAIHPAIFQTQGAPGQPGTLQGSWDAGYRLAFANANAVCTSAGASAPVTYATTAGTLASMQARITTAQGLQASSPSMLAALANALTALNSAYGAGLPTQVDASALAALQTAATTALTAAVADAQAVCTAYGINQTGGGN
jgi:hypothetical protein